jgi:hypothetical protein
MVKPSKFYTVGPDICSAYPPSPAPNRTNTLWQQSSTPEKRQKKTDPLARAR